MQPAGHRRSQSALDGLALRGYSSTQPPVSRQVLALLVEPIKADLEISDTQMSLLLGFAFAIFYTFMAIPIGRLLPAGCITVTALSLMSYRLMPHRAE